jgi:hypothetical protein
VDGSGYKLQHKELVVQGQTDAAARIPGKVYVTCSGAVYPFMMTAQLDRDGYGATVGAVRQIAYRRHGS